MTPGERLLLPARQGVALRLKQGQTLQVVNTHGKQVVDTWPSTRATCRKPCRWSTVVPSG
ncbi:DUF1989 domain-containing protein [Pseudomonas corrugata]